MDINKIKAAIEELEDFPACEIEKCNGCPFTLLPDRNRCVIDEANEHLRHIVDAHNKRERDRANAAHHTMTGE